MGMNASGPLDFGSAVAGQSIGLELGRPATPISFNDPDVRGLAGIPSGPISLSDFYGASGSGFPTTPLTRGLFRFGEYTPGPRNSTVQVQVANNGLINFSRYGTTSNPSDGLIYVDPYWSPNGSVLSGIDAWVRATPIAFDPPNGGSAAINTWLQLGTGAHYSWYCVAETFTDVDATYTSHIRLDFAATSGGTIVFQATYEMDTLINGIA